MHHANPFSVDPIRSYYHNVAASGVVSLILDGGFDMVCCMANAMREGIQKNCFYISSISFTIVFLMLIDWQTLSLVLRRKKEGKNRYQMTTFLLCTSLS